MKILNYVALKKARLFLKTAGNCIFSKCHSNRSKSAFVRDYFHQRVGALENIFGSSAVRV